MFRTKLLAAGIFLVALTAIIPDAGASASSPYRSTAALVKVAPVGTLGSIVVTAKGFTLYEWHKEKKNQIKCTGSCATAWPPLLVPAGTKLAKHIRGAMGTFGVIMRPGGSHQLTYQGKALYTYRGDTKPGEALCQAVEGWYVFSAH